MNQTKFEIKPLSPYSFEFVGQNDLTNKIDYYFLSQWSNYDEESFQKLKDSVNLLTENKDQFKLYSVYIYKETDELNENFNKSKDWLDGHNHNLIAYIRFDEGINDIFYILKDGNVVYDNVKNEKVDFEFEQ